MDRQTNNTPILSFPFRSQGWFFLFVMSLSVALLVACGKPTPTNNNNNNPPPNNNNNPPPNNNNNNNQPPPRRVVLPPKTDFIGPPTISLSKPKTKSYKLPKELQGDATIVVGVIDGIATLIGGKAGLYRLNAKEGTFLEVSKGAVKGMALLEGNKLVIARETRIQIWDSSLQSSTLHQKLDGSEITGLLSLAKDSMWISTKKKIWRYKQEKLISFPEPEGVRWMTGAFDEKILVFQNFKGDFKVLQEEKGDWSLQSLSNEGHHFDRVSPAMPNLFWGLKGGQLYQRKVDGNQAAWWPFLLIKGDDGAEKAGLSFLVMDPLLGQTWAVGNDGLYRLDATNTLKIERPKKLKQIDAATVSNDGALWFSGGDTIFRAGQEDSNITYKKHVALFLEKNCTSCHTSKSGTAFPIDTYDSAKKYASKIIKALEEKRMPPGQTPLSGGDVELIRQWLEGGLKE